MSEDPAGAGRMPGELESAMATGNDEGEPGESGLEELGPEELEVAARLAEMSGPPVVTAAEDDPRVQQAAADDEPVPPELLQPGGGGESAP